VGGLCVLTATDGTHRQNEGKPCHKAHMISCTSFEAENHRPNHGRFFFRFQHQQYPLRNRFFPQFPATMCFPPPKHHNLPSQTIRTRSLHRHRYLIINHFLFSACSNSLQPLNSPLNPNPQPTLNPFAALSKLIHQRVRHRIREIFSTKTPETLPSGSLQDASTVTMHLPVRTGDFTDFSASKDHCLNASEAIFGRRNLPGAFLNFPIAYAGRASSIVVSGTPIQRPRGQFRSSEGVVFGPSRALDFELEFGAIIGKPISRNQRLNIADVEEHIFGFVLVNDWSGG
jgi:hypothetical protein